MKEKLQSIVTKVFAVMILIISIFLLCAMLAGPLMIGWNWSFGLITSPVTYIKCLKIIIGIVSLIAAINFTLNRLSNDGDA